MASMLLGYLSSDASLSNNAQIAKPLATYLNYVAAYVHDDFRVSQKLTLNLGMRYEYEQGLSEKDDQLTVGFDPNVASPLQVPGLNLRGGLLYAGVNGNPSQQTQASKAKLGPRIGFAYAFDDKTTIRAGYGIFWAPPIFNFSITGLGAIGFSSVTTAATGAENTLSNPFPNGLIQPSGNTRGLLTQIGDTVDYTDYNRKPAYVQQYSVDVQREMPGSMVLTLSYVGSRGAHLQIGGINDAVVKAQPVISGSVAAGRKPSTASSESVFRHYPKWIFEPAHSDAQSTAEALSAVRRHQCARR
ncbi:MAG: TonB-dependent receptor [Pyrinomonadaceae bacterium]